MGHALSTVMNLFKLNWHVFLLALQGKWLSRADYAAGYDRIASEYDRYWLSQLKKVTDVFLRHIPRLPHGHIIELGCGTGYITASLSTDFPRCSVSAIDLSMNMQSEARKKVLARNVEFVCADMLDFLTQSPDNSASMIVSGWAIGYSKPSRIIRESSRVLSRGGILAFVVNYRDTLKPVFHAYRKCMMRFPASVRKALIPRFPVSYASLESILEKNGFEVVWHEEGSHAIERPKGENGHREWLLKTGVLAGFDSMLPLRNDGPVAEYFDKLLSESREPITHHYIALVAKLT